MSVNYPEFGAQSVADGYWEVFHDDDCGEAFDWFGGAGCPKCGFRPDMQSIAARKTAHVMPCQLLIKLRDFLLIVAREGANQVFLERRARELITELEKLLSPSPHCTPSVPPRSNPGRPS